MSGKGGARRAAALALALSWALAFAGCEGDGGGSPAAPVPAVPVPAAASAPAAPLPQTPDAPVTLRVAQGGPSGGTTGAEPNQVVGPADPVALVDGGSGRHVPLNRLFSGGDPGTVVVTSEDETVVTAQFVSDVTLPYVSIAPAGPGETTVVVTAAGSATQRISATVEAAEAPRVIGEIPPAVLVAGAQLLFDYDFEEALEQYRLLSERFPEHPSGPYNLATAIWTRLAQRSNAIRGPSLRNDRFFSQDGRPEPTPEEELAFQQQLEEAYRRAEALLERDPDDVEALYHLGAAEALEAGWAVIVNRAWFRATRLIRRAVGRHRRVQKLDPGFRDAYLVPGTYVYSMPPCRGRSGWSPSCSGCAATGKGGCAGSRSPRTRAGGRGGEAFGLTNS